MIEICSADDGSLAVGSVRLGDMIHTIFEIGVGDLSKEAAPLCHVFHSLQLRRFQIGVTGLVCQTIDIADSTVKLSEGKTLL